MTHTTRHGEQRQALLRNEEFKTARLFFFSFAGLLCLDLLPGPYAMHYLFDVVQTAGAQCAYTGREFLKHGVFGWDPSRWCGLPAGIAFSNPFGFQAVLLALMPMWAFYTLQKLVLLFMAGYGLYRLFREYANAPSSAALILVLPNLVLYSVGQTVNVEHYAFPLIFMWTKDLALGQGLLWGRLAKALAIALLLTMTCVAFTIPYFIPLAIMLAILAPEHWNKKRQIAVTAVVWSGCLLLGAPRIWELLDFLPVVNRVEVAHSFDLKSASIALALDFAGGFFTIYSLPILYCINDAWRDKRFRLLLGVAVAYSFVVAFLGSPFYEYVFAGTFFHKAHLYRAGIILPFCLLIVSAYALSKARRMPRYTVVFLLIALAMRAMGGSEEVSIIVVAALTISYLCIPLFVTRQWRPSPGLVLTLLGLFLLFVLNVRLVEQTSTDTHDLYAKGYENHPSLAKLYAETRAQPSFRVASIDLDPSIPKSYGFEVIDGKYELARLTFNDYMRELALPQFKTRQQAEAHFANQMLLFVTPPLKAKEFPSHDFNHGVERKLTDFSAGLLLAANVQYLFSSKPIVGIEDFATLESLDNGTGIPLAQGTALDRAYRLPIYTYKVIQPLGRAYFAERAVVLDTPGEVLPTMAAAPLDTLRRTAYLARGDAGLDRLPPELLLPKQPAAASPVEVTRYGTDALALSLEAGAPGILVIANNLDKGWSAMVNGQSRPLVRVNHTFQGLVIDRPGTYAVELSYSAPVTRALYWGALLGFLLVLSASLFPRTGENIVLCPQTHTGLALPKIDTWKVSALLAGVTALWLAGFVKFVWLRRPPDGRPFWYIAIFEPLTALAVCGLLFWCYKRLRKDNRRG